MSQLKITETFHPKKRIPSVLKRDRKQNVKVIEPEPETHPALPSKPKTVRDEELEMLRQFDLDHVFGPCVGLTRLERWERANKHSLKPPQRVKEIVTNHIADKEYSECVWFSYNI